MIRPANIEELETIVSLLRLNPDTFSKTEVASAVKNIRQLIKQKKFFIARVRDRIAGCAGFEKQDDTNGVYSLNWLAVHPSFKRRGIATKLYNLIEERVRRRGARLILLNAGSGEVNRHFYRKTGFKKSGRIPKYYGPAKDLIFYCKPL